ncbi:MAG: single-stranded DNA-binding protein [Erysipelotrichaceae bacterium]|nr:single-stranded DNA-binding protein [Erysipelotrichaceae bacterium]
MLNQIVLIGVLKSLPHDFTRDGMAYSQVELEVQRTYKDPDGQPQSDVFTVHLWRGLSEIITERYPVGSLLAVKGRLENRDGICTIIAETVSFIHPE